MGDFDFVKVGQADAPTPFSLADMFGTMEDLDLDSDAPFVGVMYGVPGSRKTTRTVKLAQALIPAGKKILYVYTGQGWTSLKNHPELQFGKDGKKNIKIMAFQRYEQIETLRAVLMNPAMREKLNIGAVIFDEYNRMQDMDTDALTRHRAGLVNSGPKRKDKQGVEVYKDPDTPEWPEYNTTKARLINLLNDIFTIKDTHFFFVCHTRTQKSTGMIEPDFPAAAASALISMVHSIYLCDKKTALDGTTTFPIELVGTSNTVSKNRIGGLPNVVYDVEPIAEAYKKWGVLPEGFTPPITASKVEAVVEKVQADIDKIVSKPEPENEKILPVDAIVTVSSKEPSLPQGDVKPEESQPTNTVPAAATVPAVAVDLASLFG